MRELITYNLRVQSSKWTKWTIKMKIKRNIKMESGGAHESAPLSYIWNLSLIEAGKTRLSHLITSLNLFFKFVKTKTVFEFEACLTIFSFLTMISAGTATKATTTVKNNFPMYKSLAFCRLVTIQFIVKINMQERTIVREISPKKNFNLQYQPNRNYIWASK